MLIPLTASLIILGVLVILMAMEYRRIRPWLIVLIPFILFNLGFTWYNLQQLAGYPSNGTIKDNSYVLHATTARPWIYVSVWQPQDDHPRLYQLPYSKKLEDQLEKIMAQMQKGQRVLIKKSQDNSAGDYEFYSWAENLSEQHKK